MNLIKRIFAVAFILSIYYISFADDGVISEIEEINLSISFVEVITTGASPGYSFLFKTRDKGIWYLKKREGSTKFITIDEGEAIQFTYKKSYQEITHFWAAVATGTDVLEITPLNK